LGSDVTRCGPLDAAELWRFRRLFNYQGITTVNSILSYVQAVSENMKKSKPIPP